MINNKQVKPYNTVAAFLECSEPEKYNFELECDFNCEADRREYKDFLPVERYLTYRATNPERKKSGYEAGKLFATKVQNDAKYKEMGDCDGSEAVGNFKLIHDVYGKLWGWEKTSSSTFGMVNHADFSCEFGGETMNSMQYMLNEIIEIVIEHPKNKNLRDIKNGNVSINYLLELYQACPEDFFEALKSVDCLDDYANAYHTLGNFTLVPSKFNAWRGNYANGIYDYWDLSLRHLKKYGWGTNFNNDGNVITDYYRYINYFFLWDYVDETGKYTFFLDRNSDDITAKINFLKGSISRISRRGYFMTAMLKLEQKLGAKDYAALRDSIFAKSDTVYSSYVEIFAKIKQYSMENGLWSDAIEKLLTEFELHIQRIENH